MIHATAPGLVFSIDLPYTGQYNHSYGGQSECLSVTPMAYCNSGKPVDTTVDLIFEGEDIGTGLVETHIWAMT